MSEEMFRALLALVDAKVERALLRNSSGPHVREAVKAADDLECEFREKFVTPYERAHRHD